MTAARWEIVRLGYSPNARWITFETADREVFVMPAHGGRSNMLLLREQSRLGPGGRRIYYVNQEAGEGTRIEAADLQKSRQTAVTSVRTQMAGVGTGTLKELAMAGDAQHMLAVGNRRIAEFESRAAERRWRDVAGPEEQLSTARCATAFPAFRLTDRRIVVGTNRMGERVVAARCVVAAVGSRSVRQVSRLSGSVRRAGPRTNSILRSCGTRDARIASWYVALDGSSSEELRPPQPALSGSFRLRVLAGRTPHRLPALAGAFSQLFVFDMTSRMERQLTLSPSHKYQASWSPDGRWVAFSANTGGGVQVWRIPAAGGEEQQLTNGFERNLHFFYSPDGRSLYVQPSHRNIWRMPADGGPLQNGDAFSRIRLIPRGADHLARWPLACLQQGRGRRLALDAHDRARSVVMIHMSLL